MDSLCVMYYPFYPYLVSGQRVWRRGRGGGGAPAQLGPGGRGAGRGGQLGLPGPGGPPGERVLLKLEQKQK